MNVVVAFPVVLACFFLSGFAALLYETVWTRQFAFVFGTSELAVATVLAGYMGGLALGAAVAGRFAQRVRRPVLVYGLLELGIALAALAVPLAIRASTALAVWLFGGQPEPPETSGPTLTLFYLGCSFAILLVPTALMGATLPLLARHAVRSESEIGPRIGILYGANTTGAVFGTLTAAYLLLPALGMFRTVLVGVALNGLVFAVAAGLARLAPAASAEAVSDAPAGAAASGETPAPAVAGRARWLLPFVLVSGITSFIYEVLWVRLLGHVLGGSVYAFATMLGSFLTGIAIGSAVASRLARTPERATRGFAAAQLGIAVASLAAFLGVGAIADVARALGVHGASGLASQALVAALALLPAALFIGATYPFAVRALATRESEAAPVSARVYAWNTVGAIVGSVAAGFWLIPGLGYGGSLSLAVALNLGLCAGTALLLLRPPPRALLVPALLGLAALLWLRPSTPWELLRVSSLDFAKPSGDGAATSRDDVEGRYFSRDDVVYMGVGRSATVLLIQRASGWDLRTNGLPEASILPPAAPRLSAGASWLCALPALARPEAHSMLVIGFGGGSQLETVPHTVRSIDVIELEPEVIAANRVISDARDVDPLADPRVRLILNDARGALVLTDKRYGLIVSQPSHPWTSGASHLYTREFFALAREHLEPGGVFLQWIDLEFVDEALLRTLVATMNATFPHVRVYRPAPRDTLFFLGSDQPFDMPASVARAVRAAPADLALAGVWGPEDTEAALALDDAGARAFAAGVPPSTDDHNLLQTRSPRVLLTSLDARRVDELLAPHDPLAAPGGLAGLDASTLARRLVAADDRERLERILGGFSYEERTLARALLALRGDQHRRAAALLESLVRRSPLAPAAYEARVVLLRLFRNQLLAGRPELLALESALPAYAAVVPRAWRLAATYDWDAVAALDPELAAIAPGDAMYPHAARLRVEWRLHGDAAERGREALVLVDDLLRMGVTPSDLLLRAQTALQARQHHAALQSLDMLVTAMRKFPDPGAAREALGLLDRVRVDAFYEPVRSRLRASLRAM